MCYLPTLTDLAKSFVMGLLYHSRPLPITDLEAWIRPGGKRYYKIMEAEKISLKV